MARRLPRRAPPRRRMAGRPESPLLRVAAFPDTPADAGAPAHSPRRADARRQPGSVPPARRRFGLVGVDGGATGRPRDLAQPGGHAPRVAGPPPLGAGRDGAARP